MIHQMFRSKRGARARGFAVLAFLGCAMLAAVPAHASVAAPTLTIQTGGSSFINAAQAGAVTVAGTYNPTDPDLVSIKVQIPATGGTCTADLSPVLDATLFPQDSTWLAGPFDVSNDLDYPQGAAICATAQAIATNPVDNSAVANSDNLPVKDTIAPAAPSSVTVDNPISAANQTTVGVNVVGEAGSTATIVLNDTDTGTGPVVDSIIASGTAQMNVTSLKDGTINASVTLRDPAGNEGASTAASSVKDATSPLGAVVMIDADGYMNKTESLRQDLAHGAIPANWSSAATDVASTSVWFEDASHVIPANVSPAGYCGPFAVGQSGNGYVNGPCAAALPEGLFYFVGKWTDTFGNTTTVRTSLIKDTVAPGGITITAPANNTQYAPGTAVTVKGTAPVGTRVKYTDDNGAPNYIDVAANGSWTKTLAGLAEGAHYLQMRSIDAAGNEGPIKDISFNLNPLVPVITGPNQAVLPSLFSLTGKGKPSSEVLLFEDRTALGRMPVGADGKWAKPLSLADGLHTLVARGIDAAGNLSSPSAPFTVLVDSSRPTASITSPENNAIIGECCPPVPNWPTRPLHFAGKATDAGPGGHFGVKRVDVKFVNALTGETAFVASACTNCGLGVADASWSLDPVIPLGGYYDVIVTSTDFAGNVSATAAIEVIIL